MADHFIETLEYEQGKNLGLVYLKVTVIESVKRIALNRSFAGCLVKASVSQDHGIFCIYSGRHSGSFISLCSL